MSESAQTEMKNRSLHGKRVAMVVHADYPMDTRPRRAAEVLVSQGMAVDLICLQSEEKQPKHEVSNGIHILRIPLRHSRGSIFTYAFEYSAFILASTVIFAFRSLRRRYDLVYVHNMPDILVLCALIPKALGAKVILDLHDPVPELMTTIFGMAPDSFAVRLLEKLEKWSIALADSVITVNRACARLFISRGCPAQKMSVIMNSPDDQILPLRSPQIRQQSTSASEKPFVIVYHGSLVERNGLELAVDAMARLRDSVPSAQLRIYGWKNDFLARVMRSVEENGLQDKVQYLGVKPFEEIVKIMAESDLGIIPNLRSRFTELNTPTRIFEYLAAGKPVIAPRAEGISDYFDESSLIFFELGSSEDLAHKIEYVFSHPAEVLEIVKRGQEVYQEYVWSKERLRLATLVAGLLAREASPIGGVETTTKKAAVWPSTKLASSASESFHSANTRKTE
jgi:glycosyltransferase involved in cell wall biosynthesis